MAEFTVALVDVFAETALQGNPLAVVEGDDRLVDDQMRRIAGEFNQAETTFLFRSSRADWKLRSFTAGGVEVFGAGHNALGAWIWLGESGQLGPLIQPTDFHQEIGRDVLPIRVSSHGGRVHGAMTQAALKLGNVVDDVDSLAAALNIDRDELLTRPAPRVADTGAGHLMVRASSRSTVDKAVPDANALLSCLRAVGAEGCYLYELDEQSPEVAYARFFNPTVRLWEDAATGTAAGPLCAYLADQSLLGAKHELVVEQGKLMGRRSLLNVVMTPHAQLSGSGIVVLKGRLSV